MQTAAKEKTFLLIFAIASALFVCAPAIASSTHASTAENRVELFLLDGQNRVGQQAIDSANRVENYDSPWGVALESSVAPNPAASRFANLSSAERQVLITQKTQEQALRRVNVQRQANGGSVYGQLPDSRSVGAGKDFTSTQRANIYQANRQIHGGTLRSDLDGAALHVDRHGTRLPNLPDRRGQTPSPLQPAVDHVQPRNPLDPLQPRGRNSYSNAEVLSRAQNGAKANR